MQRIILGAIAASLALGSLAGCYRERDAVYVDHRHDHDHDHDFDRHDEHDRHDDDRL